MINVDFTYMNFKLSIYPFLFLAILLVANDSFAQKGAARYSEYKKLVDLTLVVEQLEPDQEILATFEEKAERSQNEEKKKLVQKQLDDYLLQIGAYNESIEEAVKLAWFKNEKILFESASVVDSLRNKRNRYHIALSKQIVDVEAEETYGRIKLPIPTLIYTRLTKKWPRVDNCIYYPHVNNKTDANEYFLNSYGSLSIIQRMMTMLEETKSTAAPVIAFLASDFEVNHRPIGEKKVMILRSHMGEGTNLDKLTSYLNEQINLYTALEIKQRILNEDNILISIVIPYGVEVSTKGDVVNSQIKYLKVLIDPYTGEVYHASGYKPGQLYSPNFTVKEVMKIAKMPKKKKKKKN